jgi:hypothetical protein
VATNAITDLTNQLAHPAPSQADAGGVLGPYAFGGLPYIVDAQGRIWSLVQPRGDVLPTDVGLLEWNCDPATAAGSTVDNPAQQVGVMRIQVRAPMVITNIQLHLTQAATVLTANQSFVGLFNSAGTLLSASAAGAIDAALAGALGPLTQALATPQPVGAGFYWAAVLVASSTVKARFAVVPNSALNANVGLPAAQSRWAAAGTGATALATFTPSGLVNTAAQTYWVGVS